MTSERDVVTDTPTPTSTFSETPPSFPSVPRPQLELGDIASSMAHATLGPFEVFDVIGRGGMGIVFSGVHIGQNVPVAIKVITRKGASRPKFRQTMHNEVRAVAALDHPGVVRVLDYGNVPKEAEKITEGALKANSPYFVMELVPHGSLVDVVGKVTWTQARDILLNLLDALAHSHARDVIHRDIKPGNILMGDWGGRVIPRLADFGLAFATGMPTDASRSIGTPQYMAPEQIETPWRKHGPWSDLYSVGCVAFELLSGRKLFHGKSILEIFRQHLDGMRRPMRSIVRTPEGFDGWLEGMLERSPQDRFQSAADAARALAALDDSAVPSIRPPDAISMEIAPLNPVLAATLDGEIAAVAAPDLQWPKRFPPSMRLVGAGLGLYGLREVPLVGRRDELRTLDEALHAVEEQGARCVALEGARGIGKTKLAESFAGRLLELGMVTCLRASHTRDGGAQDGIAAMFARDVRAIGTTRVEAAGIVRERLGELGDGDPYGWKATLALIEPALGLEADGGADTGAAFEFGSNAQRYEAAIRYLRRVCESRPVVLMLDDVHYGVDSLEFVEHLLESAGDLPILVVMIASEEALVKRDEARALVDRICEREGTSEVALAPLDEVEHLSLVQDLLLLGGEVAIGVASRTAGNPGFAVTLIGDWVRRGLLRVGETGFVLEESAEPSVPRTEREVWVRSLDEVLEGRDGARHALEIAAALGTQVHSDEWTAVCGRAGVAADWDVVDELVDRRMMNVVDDGWRFAHPLVREALRQLAEDEQRWARWKRLCAEQLAEQEQRALRPKAEVLERLGMYWLDAGEFDHAIDPLQKSAEAHEQRGDYREAERIATGVVRALRKSGHDQRALAEMYLFRARTYIGAGKPDEALRWAKKALELGEELDARDIVIKSTGYIAPAKQWLGDSDAAEWIDRAYEMVDSLDATFESDGFLAVLGYVLTSLGRFEEARRVLELDRESAEAAADDRALARNSYQRGRLAFYSRDYATALIHADEARLLYRQIGQIPALASTVAMLAEIHRQSADLKRASDMYRESIELNESVGQSPVVPRANLAQILLARDDVSGAEELFLDAANEAKSTGRRRAEVVCRAGLVVCAVKQEHWTSAARLLPDIEDYVEVTEECETDLAELLEQAGDHLDEAGRWADASRVWRLARTQWFLLGDGDRADGAQAKMKRVGGEER